MRKRQYSQVCANEVQNYRDKAASMGYFLDSLSNEVVFSVIEDTRGFSTDEEQWQCFIEDIVTLLNNNLPSK